LTSATTTAGKLQITSLDPAFDDDEKHVHRRTHYERNSNLKAFSFETPFTKTGKTHGSVTEQFKRKTTLFVEFQFPSLVKRMPVVRRQDFVLTPIQCVLEDIKKRVERLKSEANPLGKLPDLKTLSQVLSGSVNMQVHGGAEEVCHAFLAPDQVTKYDPAEIALLRRVLRSFLEACTEAMLVARRLSGQEVGTGQEATRAFQEVLDQGFEKLKNNTSTLVYA